MGDVDATGAVAATADAAAAGTARRGRAGSKVEHGDRRETSAGDIKALRGAFKLALEQKDAEALYKNGTRLARKLKRAQKYTEATKVIGVTLKHTKEALRNEGQRAAALLAQLGELAEFRAAYANALKYYHEAHRLTVQAKDADPGSIHKAELRLGALQSHEDSYYQHALASHAQALELKRKAFGNLHPSVAVTLTHMGSTHCQQGNTLEALASFREALRIRCKVLGVDHPDTAATISHLAHACRLEGDYETSLSYYAWALRIREKILGPSAKAVGDTHYNIALIHLHLGEHGSSALHFRKAAVAFVHELGTDHPDTLDAQKQARLSEQRTAGSARQLSRVGHDLSTFQVPVEVSPTDTEDDEAIENTTV
ncbi:uncharacterized protein MONBRDRAFT_36052 [Monosiga brevicollis MX1]|uniref:Kinesin light chain n=1 Tax=Monosiga brevicollis TaxID=81824 RepID=A9URK4_MONBE|nr:uncharacterized protein MONBRDRAFT_36052 [Monosiga brevicollis MX1]EDQ91940.1 predicted protein [Monosiga brevicollis MX1]|eukprot:XP_001743226.1 hypothetical protein [Monosiga brevicollis MX1]